MASPLQAFLYFLSLCRLAKACLTLGTGVLSCQDAQCPGCEAEPWEGWREDSGTEPVFRKELLEMLTSTAQWGWDFARDSWWPVHNQNGTRMPSLPQPQSSAPRTPVRWTSNSCLLYPFLSGPLLRA